MQHLDDAKSAVLLIDNGRSSFLYDLFLRLPAEKKSLRMFEKSGRIDCFSGSLSEKQFVHAIEKQKPFSVILSTGFYHSLRVDSSTIVLNRHGAMILNYRGDAEISDVVEYLQSCRTKNNSCDAAG